MKWVAITSVGHRDEGSILEGFGEVSGFTDLLTQGHKSCLLGSIVDKAVN